LKKNLLMKNTAPNFYNNKIRIKIKKTKPKYKNNYTNNNNVLSTTKGKYSGKRISLNLNNYQSLNLNLNKNRIQNEEKKLISIYSPFRDSPSYLISEDNKNNENENDDANNIIKKYYKNINNIFLSDFPDNLNDYQADTYNPKNYFNLYSNYLNYNNCNINENTNKHIIKEKKIYLKHNSFNLSKENKENINTTNEINKGKLFKEIIINYNHSNNITFDGLKKNLKNEFHVKPKNTN